MQSIHTIVTLNEKVSNYFWKLKFPSITFRFCYIIFTYTSQPHLTFHNLQHSLIILQLILNCCDDPVHPQCSLKFIQSPPHAIISRCGCLSPCVHVCISSSIHPLPHLLCQPPKLTVFKLGYAVADGVDALVDLLVFAVCLLPHGLTLLFQHLYLPL